MWTLALFSGKDRMCFLSAAGLALLMTLAAGTCATQAQPGKSTWMVVEPMPPLGPEEPCDAKAVMNGFYPHVASASETPAETVLLMEAKSEGRLIWPLRNAAKTNAATALSLSAASFALARVPKVFLPAPPKLPAKVTPVLILQGGLALANNPKDVKGSRNALGAAFADLAVSGRQMHADYQKSPPTEAALIDLTTKLLAGVSGVGAADITFGAEQALTRARNVSAYLTAVIPNAAKRAGLHYIAVSGEDDQPYRPVNIPSLGYPQYNINVPVLAPNGKTVNVDTRFAVISSKPQATPQPHIPPTDVVLLFIHGDSSRLEEAGPLIKPLLAAGARHGVSYTILAMDLPSHGYTTMVDPLGPFFTGSPSWDNHAPSPPGRPSSYTILEFNEKFVVSFVHALDQKTGVAKQLLGPMGGSLGGNMCLRLASRTEPWIKQSIAWSPASVWDSLASDLVKQAGPNHCSTEGHRAEDPNTRTTFFHDQFDASTNIGPINIVKPQGDYWYRKDWPCRKTMLESGRLERREFYNRSFRQWHYRMDWEQLIFSYNDSDRYKHFKARLLLASGSEDNSSPSTQIYDSARTLAGKIVKSPAHGRTCFIEHTGHSIHDERPNLWAAEIDAFSTETRGGAREWMKVSGSPVVRFTGSKHEWTGSLAVNKEDIGKDLLQLTLIIKTGGDDLRGGSHARDNADVTIKLNSGQSLTAHNVNRGKNWGNQSVHSVQVFMPTQARVKAGDIKSLTLSTNFGGGFDGDNWNVDQLLLYAVVEPHVGAKSSP